MTDTASADATLRFPSAALPALHRALARDRSAAEAAALARQIGFEAGEGFYDTFQRWLEEQDREPGADPTTLGADRFWHRLGSFFSELGWGRLEFQRLHPGVASLASPDWAEAEQRGSAAQPTCHFTTGLLADLLGRVADGDLAVMEVRCRSRGDDRCQFLLGGVEAMEQLYGRMQGGDPYEVALERLG